jgi:hypothetical protein
MSNLIDETPEAYDWITFEKSERKGSLVFGSFEAGVIWTDELINGEVIGGVDPSHIITQINSKGWPLNRDHDPGLPMGRVVAAKSFVSPSNRKFVVAILGFYVDELKLSFDDLGVDSNPEAYPPQVIDVIFDGFWLDIATDPREVDSQWIEDVLNDVPLAVKQHELSLNAEDWQHELIRIGLPYILFVCSPFVTAIAQEAGKNVYAETRKWLQGFWNKLDSRKDPIGCV